ncbi:MAG: hypothetical protein CL920_28225 [Deltaproteobacteria bacterium]|nr:hypothetical protein [Deltaproteobacteria bacterium]MBU52601.1 hypothetical protein [Deltaproteobacteria bacterium]|tara:strand:+ start:10592 stop:11008 length:417 start_codon:yes stop_codon:yes gene_type:complete
MVRFFKRHLLWVVYFVLVLIALIWMRREPLFASRGAYPFGKYVVWAMYLGFLGYSLYIHPKENFFRTVKTIYPYLWFRQISADLYLGLVLSMFIVYLNESSIWVFLFWCLPTIFYANLMTLLYVAMHYDQLIARLLST